MSILAINGGKKLRTKPYPAWPSFNKADVDAVVKVTKSGKWWAGAGENTKKFAAAFAKYQDAKYGLSITNGTHTLEIALSAMGVGPGDEVIVPGLTFLATATAVVSVNAIPIMVDVDPDTFCIDPEKIEAAITPRTKVIIPVHLAGHICDMDKIMAIAKKHNLKVLEDCAHAHGAEWKGRKVGAIGDVGSFSFQASKCLTAGEGGALVSDNKELIDECYSYSDCGRKVGQPFYRHFVLGGNFRMTEFQAALLLNQLKSLEKQTIKRNKNALYLDKLLNQIPGITSQKRDPRVTKQGYYIYIMKYDKQKFNNVDNALFSKVLKAEGIPCQDAYPPLHFLDVFKDKNFRPKGCPVDCNHYGNEIDYKSLKLPVTEKISSETVWFTQYTLLGEKKDIEDIAKAVEKVVNNISELAK